MSRQYRDAPALRRALEDRLKRVADDTGTDLARRRRVVVFERIAARLAEDTASGWVLKGGAVMEFRLRERARTTRDIDLATLGDSRPDLDGPSVRELLIEALALDPDSDYFRFEVSPPIELKEDAAGRGGWRFSVKANLAGKVFDAVRVDVVARAEEILHTERLPLSNALEFAGTPQRYIEAVDRRQHFAEKLHALTREYGDRPNTRVKDLVDLVLIVESGIEPDATLWNAARHVFEVRGTHELPSQIPDPPPAWNETYPGLAEALTATDPQLVAGLALVSRFWEQAQRATGNTRNQQRD